MAKGNALKKMADRSRESRVRLHKLIQDGMDENQALGVLFPKDRNRTRSLDRWRKNNIFPPTVEEIETTPIDGLSLSLLTNHDQKSESKPVIHDEIADQSPSGQNSETFVGAKPPMPHLPPNDENDSDTWVTREEFTAQIAELIAMIEALQTRLQDQPKRLRTPEHECPRPIRQGKKFTVQRSKIGATIDPVLLSLLLKEANERNMSLSSLLDEIVWLHFGRPRLSFEESGDTQ